MIASTFGGVHDFFSSGTWQVIRNLLIFFMLGQNAPGSAIFEGLVPTILLNLVLTFPVYALTRRLVPPREWAPREVRLLA